MNKLQRRQQQENRRKVIGLWKIGWLSLLVFGMFYSFQIKNSINDMAYYSDLDESTRQATAVSGKAQGSEQPAVLKSTAASSTTQQSEQHVALNLIENNQVQYHDYFSDSFLVNKDTFLSIPLNLIGIVEDACFAAVGKKGPFATSKMFVDFMDFSVEHMSKWWGELKIFNDQDDANFRQVISFFNEYLKKMSRRTEQSPLQETIAMIAFAPYRGKGRGQAKDSMDRGKELTKYSLASTIASLYRVGFGRVVVTGHNDDKLWVDEAFKLLGSTFNNEDAIIPSKIGNTELGYAFISDESWFKTKWVKFNMPMAAIVGMMKALKGEMNQTQQTEWLGSMGPSHWKYVYLTEPDTLLVTKPFLLPAIRDGLDKGLRFFPHRLQPLPHEADLPAEPNDPSKKHISNAIASRFVPNVGVFKNVTVMNSWEKGEVSHCCDSGLGWPGRSVEFGVKQRPCGDWWWLCGFQTPISQKNLSDDEVMEKHKRLAPYPMMRLQDSTNVVFGPTEMGRRCIPSKTPCPIKG